MSNKTVVVLGRMREGNYEVLEGLDEDDVVIGTRLDDLADGTPVTTVMENAR